MTPPDAQEIPPIVEPASVIKLPEGYVPTNTEMVVRGAGMQVENKAKQLDA